MKTPRHSSASSEASTNTPKPTRRLCCGGAWDIGMPMAPGARRTAWGLVRPGDAPGVRVSDPSGACSRCIRTAAGTPPHRWGARGGSLTPRSAFARVVPRAPQRCSRCPLRACFFSCFSALAGARAPPAAPAPHRSPPRDKSSSLAATETPPPPPAPPRPPAPRRDERGAEGPQNARSQLVGGGCSRKCSSDWSDERRDDTIDRPHRSTDGSDDGASKQYMAGRARATETAFCR